MNLGNGVALRIAYSTTFLYLTKVKATLVLLSMVFRRMIIESIKGKDVWRLLGYLLYSVLWTERKVSVLISSKICLVGP